MRAIHGMKGAHWPFRLAAIGLVTLLGTPVALADASSLCQRLASAATQVSQAAQSLGCDFDFTSEQWNPAAQFGVCMSMFSNLGTGPVAEALVEAQWTQMQAQRAAALQQCSQQQAATPLPAEDPPAPPPPAAPAPAGGMNASTCSLPSGVATVVIKDPKVTRLNVRDRPAGNIVGGVAEGTQVTVLGACGVNLQAGIVANPQGNKPPVPGWCAIAEPVGCVAEQFLVPGVVPTQQGEATPQNTPGTQVVVTIPQGGNLARLTSSKGGQATVLTSLPKGSDVNVLGCERGWCRIAHPRYPTAWLFQDFLQFEGPGAGPAPIEVTVNTGGGAATGGGGPAAGLVATPAPGTAAASFTGNWYAVAQGSDYDMQLSQSGSAVTGNYRGADGSVGQIEGSVDGNVLRFRWRQIDGLSGAGKFALAKDGRAFSGSFTLGTDPDVAEGSWNGTRR